MCHSLWAARLGGFLPRVPGALAELQKAILLPACRDFCCHRPLFSHSHCIYKLQNWTFTAWPPHPLCSCFLVHLHVVVAILSWVVSLLKPGPRRQSAVLHCAGYEIRTVWKGASVSGEALLQRVQQLLWYIFNILHSSPRMFHFSGVCSGKFFPKYLHGGGQIKASQKRNSFCKPGIPRDL